MEIQSFLKSLIYLMAGWLIITMGLMFVAFVFPSIGQKISLIKSGLFNEYVVLRDDITVTEISDNEEVLPYEYESGTGDVPAAKEMVLEAGGEISDRLRVFDKDPGKNVDVLIRNNGLSSLVFKDNSVFNFKNSSLGELIGQFSNPELQLIRHVVPVNDKYALVNGDRASAKYADPYLWQVELTTLNKSLITKQPYYSFKRPPKIFLLPDEEVAVVYYVDDIHFGIAMGGDNSRPKYSVVRVYNKDYPKGSDIVQFRFTAGTIINVTFDDGLIVTGDPSRPGGSKKYRKPARVWRVDFTRV